MMSIENATRTIPVALPSLFLQVRSQVLNNDLTTSRESGRPVADFGRWYPGFTHRGGPVEPAA